MAGTLDAARPAAPCWTGCRSCAARRVFDARATARRPHQPQLPRITVVREPTTSRGSPARKSDLLAIDRDAEAHNSRSGRDASASDRTSSTTPRSDGILVVDWIDGRTFTDADLDDAGRLAAGRRRPAGRCTPARGSLSDFDMFDVQRRYLRIVRDHGFRLPADYLDFADTRFARSTAVLHSLGRRDGARATTTCWPRTSWTTATGCGSSTTSTRATTTPASNSATSGARRTCSTTGSTIWSPATTAPRRRSGPREPGCSRLMSKYGWTLWASIQDAVSEVDFDFWQWGHGEVRRARSPNSASPDFARH